MTTLTDRFLEALALATRLHAAQRRKVSDTPYVGHLLAVAAIVLEHGADEDEAVAALLHDAVEDQGGAETLRRIEAQFGPRVAGIVAECSDTQVTPKPPWRERKERHLAHVLAASPSARRVLAADKLDNARSLARELRRHGDVLWDHFRGGREGTLWYHRAMLQQLRAAERSAPAQIAALLDELEQALAQLPASRVE